LTDPITIAEFKKLDPKKTYTSCLQVKVTDVLIPTEGQTDGRKWKRQAIIITDNTGELKLSLFNGRIGKFILGRSYLICNLAVDSWEGRTTAKIVSATTIKEVTATSDDYLKNKQKEIENQLKFLPKLAEKLEGLAIKESTVMFQIKKTIEANISQYETLPNQGMLWQMTEKLFDRHYGKKP